MPRYARRRGSPRRGRRTYGRRRSPIRRRGGVGRRRARPVRIGYRF